MPKQRKMITTIYLWLSSNQSSNHLQNPIKITLSMNRLKGSKTKLNNLRMITIKCNKSIKIFNKTVMFKTIMIEMEQAIMIKWLADSIEKIVLALLNLLRLKFILSKLIDQTPSKLQKNWVNKYKLINNLKFTDPYFHHKWTNQNGNT